VSACARVDVDLLCARGDGRANLLDALRQRRQPGGKAGRHSGDRNAGAAQSLHGGRHELVIDADRTDVEAVLRHAEGLEQIVAHWAQSLRAQAAHITGRVVAGERSKVHQRDRTQQPRRLPLLLHRASRDDRRRAALNGAAVDAYVSDPVELEREAGIALRLVQLADRGVERALAFSSGHSAGNISGRLGRGECPVRQRAVGDGVVRPGTWV
jgi:hypothetical protein